MTMHAMIDAKCDIIRNEMTHISKYAIECGFYMIHFKLILSGCCCKEHALRSSICMYDAESNTNPSPLRVALNTSNMWVNITLDLCRITRYMFTFGLLARFTRLENLPLS